MKNIEQLKSIKLKTNSSSNPFLEKVLPAASILLTLQLVSVATHPMVTLVLCVGHMAINVVMSKLSKRYVPLEHLKMLFNISFACWAPLICGVGTPIWLINLLSIFRVPVTYTDKKTSRILLVLLCIAPAFPYYVLTGQLSAIIAPVCLLSAISLMSSSILFHLNDKSQKLEDSQVQNVESAKMASLGMMAGGIAHEINTPLGAILLNAQMIEMLVGKTAVDKKVSTQISDRTVLIEKTCSKINSIISALRTIAKDTSEGEELSSVTIPDLVEETLNLSKERARRWGVELNVNIPDHISDQEFFLPRAQIAQVLLNLVNNSFDAIEETENPWLSINVLLREDKLVFEIVDSGEKISEEIKDKLFEPFFTTKEVGKGAGIGLSLSRSMIESNRGKIYIDENHHNTCFTVALPLAEGFAA